MASSIRKRSGAKRSDKSHLVSAVTRQDEREDHDGNDGKDVNFVPYDDFSLEGVSPEELKLWSKLAPAGQKLEDISSSPTRKRHDSSVFKRTLFAAVYGTTTWSSTDTYHTGKSKPAKDLRLTQLNRFLRQHEFFVRSSFAKFTSSKRRAFERDVSTFAETLNLPEKVAKEEISKARKFCREDLSNCDDSAWFDEFDDSNISVSLGSRATSPTKTNPNDARPSHLQLLSTDGEYQSGKMAPGFSDSKLDSNLRSQLRETQTSPIEKASKKRTLEQTHDDDHDAKRTDAKRDRTGRAKKAKLQAPEPGDHEPATASRQDSTSIAKNPSATIEDQVPKPAKKRKQREKSAEVQRIEEVINQTDFELSQGPEESRNNVSIAGQEEQINLDPLRSRTTVKSGPEKSNDQLAEICNDEEADGSGQKVQSNGIKELSTKSGSLKSQRKTAKRAKRRAAQRIRMVKEEGKANPPEPKLSSDEKGPEQVENLPAEQDHSPQDFHSPMIQSV